MDGSKPTIGSSFVEFSKRSKVSLGLDQCLGQVSSNSENVQNIVVLHSFRVKVSFIK